MNACESHSWKEAAMNSNNRLPVLMPILALQLVCGCGGGSQSSGSMFPPDISGSYTITLVGSSGGSAILHSTLKQSQWTLCNGNLIRSEERSVGKECKFRWSPDHTKKNIH